MFVPRNDPDEWYDTFSSLPEQQGYDFLIETLKTPLPDGFSDRVDVVDILLEYCDSWTTEKHHDKVLEIAGLMYAHNADILKDAFEYIDRRVIDIHLFRGQPDKLDFQRFKGNPVKSIDTLIPLLDKLVFYGHTDLALDISEHVYPLVVDAPGLIGGAELEFVDVIFMLKWQQVYERMKAGEPVAREGVIGYLHEYGYEIEDVYDEIEDHLINYGTVVDYDSFARDEKSHVSGLGMAVARYLFDEKGINFSAVEKIWMGAQQCFERTQPGRARNPFDDYFSPSKEKLDKYVSGRLGWLSNQKPNAFGVLWGLPYVYDFLSVHGWISESVHRSALDTVTELKREVINAYDGSLWEYDFVHCWPCPDSIEQSTFDQEAELFRQSFYENVKRPKRYTRVTDTGKEANGAHVKVQKIGRNDPCPCGSGKKYKKCCLNR